jgi:hypothetical protein
MRFHKYSYEKRKPLSGERGNCPAQEGGKAGLSRKEGNAPVIRFDFHINHIKRDPHV